MNDGIRQSPFTDEEVIILKLWQKNEYLHPYICCNCEPMEVNNDGLKCIKCNNK